MKTPSVLMGALTLTAILLAVILLSVPSREAQAVMNVTGGQFTMLTSGSALGQDEALTIIDNKNEKVRVYRLLNNKLEVIGGVDSAKFDQAFARPSSK
jgi:hypothetical protein